MANLYEQLDNLKHSLDKPEQEHAKYRNLGRKKTGGPNACAATVSAYLVEAGIIPGYILVVKDLVKKLQSIGWVRIDDLNQADKYDLIVSKDLNERKGPDHIVWNLSRPVKKNLGSTYGQIWVTTVVDNQQPTPYYRNLFDDGPKTGGEYLLRHPLLVARKLSPLAQERAGSVMDAIQLLYDVLGKLKNENDDAIDIVKDLRYNPLVDAMVRYAKEKQENEPVK